LAKKILGNRQEVGKPRPKIAYGEQSKCHKTFKKSNYS
jgi:hypothetical protein